MDRSRWPTRVIRPGESPPRDPVRDLRPEERMSMAWQITLEAYEVAGIPVDPHVRRDIVRVVRKPC